ncbi:glycosyl hydrolase [Pseudomonas sp. BN414]|uniref:WD40/YVTN/BNR-like repeat-containing protein n=1 Tax=Pseudomonas TaxID=286 RepID=UPI0015C0E25F|nr:MULTISPECIES: glycosyl hydrolase [Pseudomonas]MDH4561304.1 glycosyl hydrolase [Pseudomonas sp. BN411]MDH4568236.1 glycosyl hydrolase [Pseudomonas sp. BN414]MDH4580705.1 glycosyl hydrolase [Pseudomonas sp. BN415]MDH4657004.1 glycosyl hydrolase [Pseudomonas sp. BN606]NWL77982.1 glycosyl hydrolase [Pseudomonas taiwanensis]
MRANKKALLLTLLLSITWCTSHAHAGERTRPVVLDRPAVTIKHPDKGFLLAAARAGNRLVAVGEKGLIVLSDDQGATWRQAREVPASVLLTDVAFANDTSGWAVGHLGVVLHTEDGGETWSRQLDGIQAAQLVLAEAVHHSTAGTASSVDQPLDALTSAQNLVADGPDKPFLSLSIRGAREVLVAGAYGLMYRTVNGGLSWTSENSAQVNPGSLHFYALTQSQGPLYVAGEQGLLLSSEDGKRFRALQQPYEGTLFGAVVTKNSDVLAFGLRGNLVRSSDHGQSWSRIESGVSASLQASEILDDGAVVLGSDNGQIIVSRDGGEKFSPLAQSNQPVADILQLSREKLLVVGPLGVEIVQLEAK